MLELFFSAATILSAFSLIVSASSIISHEAAQWRHRSDDSDLFNFITRPDLKPPRLQVTLNKKEWTAPGYIFVAPYDCMECSSVPATSHTTQQMGPLIYTQGGDLVWSGADQFIGTKVFDFKAVMVDGGHHLSLIAPPDAPWQPFPNGIATVLNASYQPIFTVDGNYLGKDIDMHEFNVLKDGQTALVGVTNIRESRTSDSLEWIGRVADPMFIEVNVRTRRRSFSWSVSDHVSISESSHPAPSNAGTFDAPWDWFQLNSMDKDMFGNYLISGRMTNTIYYISPTGSILWRLGGLASSFKQDFNFSRQSHVRIRDQSDDNMVISFFDNASDDLGAWQPTSNSSSLLVIGLDLGRMTATMYHRHEHPAGGLTTTGGSIQFLPNGGVFAGWGDSGHMSEYVNRGGAMLYEAAFASKRFSNYRAFKMEFTAQPRTKPISRGFVSTSSQGNLRTAIYVSWNGATEVASWRFYSHSSRRGKAKNVLVGQTSKTGFETRFTASGYHPITFAEALDVNGNILGTSMLDVTDIPVDFHSMDDPPLIDLSGASLTMRTAVAFVAGLIVAGVWTRFGMARTNASWKHVPMRWKSKHKQ